MSKGHFYEYREQQRRLRNEQAPEAVKQNHRRAPNLNKAFVPDDQGDIYWNMQDYSTLGNEGTTRVFFKGLEDHLIRLIQEADILLGCVAWLTSEPILEALSKKKGVSIIVQKEDFLRPDLVPDNNWSRRLRQLYESLPRRLDWRDFSGPLGMLASETDPIIDPVRCVGNYNTNKQPACPRSHHKFVLFCRATENCTCKSCQGRKKFFIEVMKEFCDCDHCLKYEDHMMHIRPYAAWTGSFNFTRNAVMSFENAVVLYDTKIVDAFYEEYSQIAALSEPLDWTKPWIDPQWRIQTWT